MHFWKICTFFMVLAGVNLYLSANLVLLIVKKETVGSKWSHRSKSQRDNCAGLICLAVSCSLGNVCRLKSVWIG